MRFAFVLCAISLMACASASTPTVPGNDATADAPPRVPKLHRASAGACPTDRPSGTPGTMPDGKCTTDADCKDGKNGRCNGGLLPNACSYDECVVDADCGTAVCDCRTGKIGQPNVCFKGNCRTDADCKGNYCSPSATTVTYNCTGPALGSFGYFCHSTQDECVDDADCAAVALDARCVFDVDKTHWACVKLTCTR